MPVKLLLLLLLPILVACTASSGSTGYSNLGTLLHDEVFTPVTDLPMPADVFGLPPEAVQELRREFDRQRMAPGGDGKPAHSWLAAKLNAANGGFHYQDNDTRIAAETYYDRAGNCMSLVVLTAAMADALNVAVDFQEVQVPPMWDRQGDFYLVNGHVNLRLLVPQKANVFHFGGPILVDFLPQRAIRGYELKHIQRGEVLAMFYNNQAAETLVRGDFNRAYGLIRLALSQRADFVPALNTLGILYRYNKRQDLAEMVYREALRLEPKNLNTLYNLALILAAQDRLDEWAEVHKVLELARIGNPYYYYDLAEQALAQQEYRQAVDWYLRALQKADYRHEFYFGLSKAYLASGDAHKARQSLEKALALSRDENNKRRYQAKLNAMTTH